MVDAVVNNAISARGNERWGILEATLIARNTTGYEKYREDIPVESATTIVVKVPSMKNMLAGGRFDDLAMMKIKTSVVRDISIWPPSKALSTIL